MASPLLPQYLPREVSVAFEAALVAAAEDELRAKARADEDLCRGYFPALANDRDIDSDLPHSAELAASQPEILVGGLPLGFNSLRFSGKRQRARWGYHIDSDSATAVTGSFDTIHQRDVWRLLLNLSPELAREFSFVPVKVEGLPLDHQDGYVFLQGEPPVPPVPLILPPRTGEKVSGVLFASNRVLHSGKDGAQGHFVAGYGHG